MKSRPIIMRADEVRAILDGRKTQFRRPIKPQPVLTGFSGPHWPEHTRKPWMPVGGVYQDRWICPHGQPGDRLWVRETWYGVRDGGNGDPCVAYSADNPHKPDRCRWMSSIHMPRWASRITLEIVRVRVERVQDITDQDAFDEGAPTTTGCLDDPCVMSFRQGFHDLWQSTHGTWDANPWVWVVEFRRINQ